MASNLPPQICHIRRLHRLDDPESSCFKLRQSKIKHPPSTPPPENMQGPRNFGEVSRKILVTKNVLEDAWILGAKLEPGPNHIHSIHLFALSLRIDALPVFHGRRDGHPVLILSWNALQATSNPTYSVSHMCHGKMPHNIYAMVLPLSTTNLNNLYIMQIYRNPSWLLCWYM